MARNTGKAKRGIVYALLLTLLVLHQDVWLWDDARLVAGFIPMGLFYHAVYTVVTAAVWALAIGWAWPVREEPEPEPEGSR